MQNHAISEKKRGHIWSVVYEERVATYWATEI